MRVPESLIPLLDQGIIQEVVRPLMSGKEAQIYLVVSDDQLRVAKVYKTANNRSFHQRAEYTEGRAVRNSRTRRAMGRRSSFGRSQDEAAWRTAEVEIIYRLHGAGLLVPEPYNYIDGVLLMELITGMDGDPAPRLADVSLDPESARLVFTTLLSQVVGMLCVGVVHGDLSEFNVLLGQYGPVVIDFPQAVDPAHNQNARKLLVRDLDNLQLLLTHSVPGSRRLPYGQELWALYTKDNLTPDTQLTGRYRPPKRKANTESVLYEVEVAERDARQRQEAQDPKKRGRGRREPGPKPPVEPAKEAAGVTNKAKAKAPNRGAEKPTPAPKAKAPNRGAEKPTPAPKAKAPNRGAETPAPAPAAKRRRRRRRRGSQKSGQKP